jgi:hypothetical protein
MLHISTQGREEGVGLSEESAENRKSVHGSSSPGEDPAITNKQRDLNARRLLVSCQNCQFGRI